MENSASRRPAPFSLRLSLHERQQLDRLAAGESLSSFIKRHIFTEQGQRNAAPPTKRWKAPVKDHVLLAQVLAVLGHSRLSQSMNQLAKAANSGTLPLPHDVERDLRQACVNIQYMRSLLLGALGMRVEEKPEGLESLSQTFARAKAAEVPLEYTSR